MGSRSAAQLRSREHRYGDFPLHALPISGSSPRGARAGESRSQGAGALPWGRSHEQGLGSSPEEGEKMGFFLDKRKTLNWVRGGALQG